MVKHRQSSITHGMTAKLIPRLVNVLGSDQWSEDVVPTVAFNLRQVRKGNVTMKVWDVAVCPILLKVVVGANDQGQPKFRGMWDRYCRGADAILYVPFCYI